MINFQRYRSDNPLSGPDHTSNLHELSQKRNARCTIGPKSSAVSEIDRLHAQERCT